jgi:V/A-type H+/Na+-transporting ATPase subunit D
MAKIKHSKTELKAQKESLTGYQRFLPMLQLKKQQLRAEIQSIDAAIEKKTTEFDRNWEALTQWVALFSSAANDVRQLVTLRQVLTERGNIAGVAIPIFQSAELGAAELDLFTSPSWLDDARDAIGALIRIRIEKEIFVEQRRLIEAELRTTSQRVNLFEKVKIPECQENIRIIKIFLGDEQTSAVARGKIAKRRSQTE